MSLIQHDILYLTAKQWNNLMALETPLNRKMYVVQLVLINVHSVIYLRNLYDTIFIRIVSGRDILLVT